MAQELLVQPGPLARLLPVTAGDHEIILNLPKGKVFTARLTSAKPRSVLQNRFYWALLNKVVENTDHYRRAEQLHMWMKVRLGYVETIEFHDGKVITKVSSTSFERMEPDEFKVYLDAVIAVICEEVIPDLPRSDLMREIESMTHTSYDALWAPAKKVAA